MIFIDSIAARFVLRVTAVLPVIAFTLPVSIAMNIQVALADGMVELPPGAKSPQSSSQKASSQKGGAVSAEGQGGSVADSSKSPQKVGRAGRTDPLGEFDLARYQYCGKDSDCVLTVNGCCDCEQGGQQVAVNQQRLEDFRKNFDCLYVSCGEGQPDNRCANAVVSCVDHKCKNYLSGDAPPVGQDATEKM